MQFLLFAPLASPADSANLGLSKTPDYLFFILVIAQVNNHALFPVLIWTDDQERKADSTREFWNAADFNRSTRWVNPSDFATVFLDTFTRTRRKNSSAFYVFLASKNVLSKFTFCPTAVS